MSPATFHQFKGSGPLPPSAPRGDAPARVASLTNPRGYEADKALADAVNVALALDMPLLLTGEPGTGKTQLAYRVAAELTTAEPLRFDTKSSSQANDLFFSFESMRYFAQSQIHATQRTDAAPAARDFVHYHALGEAILRTHPRERIAELLPDGFPDYTPGRSVVLIDEIDKAPRDFPNDLLNQIENLEFRVQEVTTATIRADANTSPIVIITSNSEKQLPDPFLRRCVYHHIAFPKERIHEIVAGRLRGLPIDAPAYAQAKDFFFTLRDTPGIEKKPSTSELLDWLRALHANGLEGPTSFADQREVARSCLGSLVKTEADRDRASQALASAR